MARVAVVAAPQRLRSHREATHALGCPWIQTPRKSPSPVSWRLAMQAARHCRPHPEVGARRGGGARARELDAHGRVGGVDDELHERRGGAAAPAAPPATLRATHATHATRTNAHDKHATNTPRHATPRQARTPRGRTSPRTALAPPRLRTATPRRAAPSAPPPSGTIARTPHAGAPRPLRRHQEGDGPLRVARRQPDGDDGQEQGQALQGAGARGRAAAAVDGVLHNVLQGMVYYAAPRAPPSRQTSPATRWDTRWAMPAKRAPIAPRFAPNLHKCIHICTANPQRIGSKSASPHRTSAA